MSYSGDCRPTKEFANCATNSTVLIHEATFQSDLQDQAILKMHTTIEEALLLGVEASADKIVLTHFSQRYTVSTKGAKKNSKAQEKPEITKILEEKGIVAFDLMHMKFSDLDIMPKLSKIINFPVCESN